MKRARFSTSCVVLACLCGLSCALACTEERAVRTVDIRVREPDGTSLLEDAQRVSLAWTVDDALNSVELAHGSSLRAPDRIALTGGLLELTVAVVPGEAFGRSARVRVEPSNEPLVLPLVLAPVDHIVRMESNLPGARVDDALCDDVTTGQVWTFGGHDASGPVDASYTLDPLTLHEVSLPAVGARNRASCAPDGEGGVLVYGGCDGTDLGSVVLDGTTAFTALFDSISDTGCGAVVVTAGHAGFLATPSGARFFELRDSKVQGSRAKIGDDIPLRARAFPQAVVLKDGALLLTGGVVSVDDATPIVGASVVAQNDSEHASTLVSDQALLRADVDGALALEPANGGRLARLGGATDTPIDLIDNLHLEPHTPRAFVLLPDGVAAVLVDDGTSVVLADGRPNPPVLTTAHPRTHLSVGPGGVVVLTGGSDGWDAIVRKRPL